MIALHSDLSPDIGCWRNDSIHTYLLVSARNEETRDIRALSWRPGLVVFPLYFPLHIFYKQPQRILQIWNVFQYDICALAEMSSMDVNRGEAPHCLDADLDSLSARM